MKMLTVKNMSWYTVTLSLLLILAVTWTACGYGVTISTPIPTPIVQQQALTISAGDSKVFFVTVNSGDRMAGTFNISGGGGNDVNFSIKDPSGNMALSGGRVSNQWQFDFVCASTGSYQLVFDNSFSRMSNKAVNLNLTIYPK